MDHEIVIHIQNGGLLAIRNNDKEFEGKWIQLEDIILSEVSQDQKHKDACFLSYVEDRSKNKHIHKKKYVHIQTQL
jgi:hypothetical protein